MGVSSEQKTAPEEIVPKVVYEVHHRQHLQSGNAVVPFRWLQGSALVGHHSLISIGLDLRQNSPEAVPSTRVGVQNEPAAVRVEIGVGEDRRLHQTLLQVGERALLLCSPLELHHLLGKTVQGLGLRCELGDEPALVRSQPEKTAKFTDVCRARPFAHYPGLFGVGVDASS